ncbi:hypothetical protein HH395_001933 [Escherichia coli]|nr:hypothetical protein [Escherichia coli]
MTDGRGFRFRRCVQHHGAEYIPANADLSNLALKLELSCPQAFQHWHGPLDNGT